MSTPEGFNPDHVVSISAEEHAKILKEVQDQMAGDGAAKAEVSEPLPLDEEEVTLDRPPQTDEEYEKFGPRTFRPTPEQQKKLLEDIRSL